MASKKKAKPKRIAGMAVAPAPRKLNPPRTAFKPGNPHAFKPGQSGNPGGKPKGETRLISKALLMALPNRAPNEVANAFGLQPGASWAQCIAQKLIVLAVRGDLTAMREIREATEGTRARVAFTDEEGNLQETPPLIELVFVSSDGNGYPAPTIIDFPQAPNAHLAAGSEEVVPAS